MPATPAPTTGPAGSTLVRMISAVPAPSRLIPGLAVEDLPDLWHVTRQEAWERALETGVFVPVPGRPYHGGEPYLRTTYPEQLQAVTSLVYPERPDGLVALQISIARLPAGTELRLDRPAEDDPRQGRRFPHIYGPVPTTAVVAARPLGWLGDMVVIGQ
jgi:uncharacterized protein (DUF952 family)